MDLALFFNGASYFVSAMTVYSLRQIGKREHSGIDLGAVDRQGDRGGLALHPAHAGRPRPGDRDARRFCAAGVVIGLAPSYIQYTLGGGSAGFSLVFAAILIGLAIGMGFGSRPFGDFSRRRLFGVTLTASAVPLAMIALVPNLAIVTVFVFLMGVISGTAYPTGFTIVGLEVDDDTRGRVFAFFQSTIQAILLAVIAVAGFIATGFSAAIQALSGAKNGVVHIAHITYGSPGDNLLLLLSAALVAFVGIQSYRQLDDRRGVPLFEDLWAAVRNEPLKRMPAAAAAGRPAGAWPGGPVPRVRGRRGRGQDHAGPADRDLAARAGLRRRDHPRARRDQGRDAAARAAARHRPRRHVAALPRRCCTPPTGPSTSPRSSDPALERGAVVITDRYIDSSLAYQGAGRGIPTADIARLNSWATDGRTPDLTVLLDMPPEIGLQPACPLGRPDRGRAA